MLTLLQLCGPGSYPPSELSADAADANPTVINSPDPTVSATTALTEVTVIVHKDDFMKELGWCAVQDAVHSTEQGRQGFVVETDNNTSDWQVHRVRLVLTSVKTHMRKCDILKGSNVLGHYSLNINCLLLSLFPTL